MKISYIGLGCAKNQVDLEYLIGELVSYGFETEPDPALCDAVVINTCGFIESAVKEAIEAILTAARSVPSHAKIVVTGCMTERYKDEVKAELPEIDFIAGAGDLSAAAEYLKNLGGVDAPRPKAARVVANCPYYAYLKISEGCDNRCSYCTIPSIRGPLRSRSPEDIIRETETLVASGAKEIIIVSQDTTKYGKDDPALPGVTELLRKIFASFPDTLFRLLYLNPDGVTEELLRLIAGADNAAKYLDIPVQHASDKILKSMRRKSDRARIDEVFDSARRIVPEAFIRTTFIVGFPGETESDFGELADFISEKKPDFAGFFPYSPEEGTQAALLGERPSPAEVKHRIKKLQALQKKNTAARLGSLKGGKFTCFVEKPNEDFDFILEGRAVFQAPDVDGRLYVIEGRASDGYGPYTCSVKKIVYPDVYVKLED